MNEAKDKNRIPSDRRKVDIGAPSGDDRRKKADRRLIAHDGHERYLDMVQKERNMLISQGHAASTEQLLDLAGATTQAVTEDQEGTKYTATGDALRAKIPVQYWLPLNIHLIGLNDGTLKVAPLNELNQKQKDLLLTATNRTGFYAEQLEIEVWDRQELLRTIQTVQDLSTDRCEKTLAEWLADTDNGLLLNQFVRDMLAESLQMRVSDIHLVQDNNPDAPNWIRYRIDGDIVPMHLLPNDAMARLTTLLKRDAGMNFGDRVTPKDGRFSFTWQGRTIDVRVAAGPQAQDGEKITMRLLDRAALRGFNELFKRHEEVGYTLQKLLSPEIKGGGGMIILSGPTGSGKTTTMYACIQEIDRRRRHVLTIEDPIEYELRYATQWQVRPGMPGGEFSDLIRASMRHDPDYIVIGELRDSATVETALKAAESGHTVITTVHADTALQTFERLKSLMPSDRERSSIFTLAQQVRCILNQRLVKTLCQACAHRERLGDIISEKDSHILDLPEETMVRRQNHSGCELCNRTGIAGRTLLLDALMVHLGPSERGNIYTALMENVNNIVGEDGIASFTRQEGLIDLVVSGQVDPISAISYLDI